MYLFPGEGIKEAFSSFKMMLSFWLLLFNSNEKLVRWVFFLLSTFSLYSTASFSSSPSSLLLLLYIFFFLISLAHIFSITSVSLSKSFGCMFSSYTTCLMYLLLLPLLSPSVIVFLSVSFTWCTRESCATSLIFVAGKKVAWQVSLHELFNFITFSLQMQEKEFSGMFSSFTCLQYTWKNRFERFVPKTRRRKRETVIDISSFHSWSSVVDFSSNR